MDCSFRRPEIDMICRLGTPALDHSVMAVAGMLCFVYILDNPAASLMFFIMFTRVLKPSGLCSNHTGAGMAQLATARLSEQEVPGSILGDFNVCFDFPLLPVAIAYRSTDRGRGV